MGGVISETGIRISSAIQAKAAFQTDQVEEIPTGGNTRQVKLTRGQFY